MIFKKVFKKFFYHPIKDSNKPNSCQGSWVKQNWIFTALSLQQKLEIFWDFLKLDFSYILLCNKKIDPLVVPSLIIWSWFEQTLIYVWCFFGKMIFEKMIFEKYKQIFLKFLITPIWRKFCPSVEQTGNPSPRMLYAKFGWNWSSGEENVKSLQQQRQ